MSEDPSLFLQGADLAIKVIATLGGAIAFLVGLRQYKRSQSWQRSQLVLSLIDSFEHSKEIEAACAMLDWDERKVDLGGGRDVRFRNEQLVSAFRVPAMDLVGQRGSQSAGDAPFTSEEGLIRDAFDAFFDFFDKLYAFRRADLLTQQDCVYFNYWLELLLGIGDYKKNAEIKSAMDRYIDSYHFKGVRKLLEEYDAKREPLSILPSSRRPNPDP